MVRDGRRKGCAGSCRDGMAGELTDTKRETALGWAWVLSATPGNAGIRIVNVCLTPASSQAAAVSCRVNALGTWAPTASAGAVVSVMSPPHLLDRKLWLETGSILGRWGQLWRLLASQSGLLPSARAIAKPPAPRHHPLFEELHRCCWLTSPEHRKQHYTLHTFRVSRASDCHNSVILDPTLSTCGTDRLPAPSLFSSLPQLHHLHHHHPPCPVRSAQQPPLQDVTNPLLVRRPGTQISMTPSPETACARPPPPEGPPPL